MPAELSLSHWSNLQVLGPCQLAWPCLPRVSCAQPGCVCAAFQKALESSMVKGLLSAEAAEGAYQSAQKIMREAGAFDKPQGSVPKPAQAQE